MLLQFFFFSSSSVWEKRFTFCFASILQLSYYSLHGDKPKLAYLTSVKIPHNRDVELYFMISSY